MQNKAGKTAPVTHGEATSVTGDTKPVDGGMTDQVTGGEGTPAQPNTAGIIPLENMDPMRRRIANSRRRPFIVKLVIKLVKWIAGKVKPDPTPEEKAELEERKRRKALEKLLTREAKDCLVRLRNCLTRKGICYITRRSDGTSKRVIQVKFDLVLMEPNALYFRVNRHRLPFGVSYKQLTDEETCTDLSIAVGHKVTASWNEIAGVWYVVERATGIMGIPAHVNLNDMWTAIPASKDFLTIPVGYTNNSKPVYMSLDDMVHMLIAGTTGGGKSNFLNVVLCTLIRRNRPDKLKLLLVDLKGGLEFNYYEGIPHLVKDVPEAPGGIVYKRENVGPLLEWVIREGERRMGVLLHAGAKNIGEYNARRRKGIMPHMVVVIDEWADVKLGHGGKETETMLANSVQRMRAVGIHVIVCTQVPQREVLGTLIKANLPAKFAFSCADYQASMSILNNANATNLQPKGRCVVKFQSEITVQTPFIPKPIILQTIRGAITGSYEAVLGSHDVTEQEAMEWALENNNGWLSTDHLYAQFKSRGLTSQELRSWLQSWEGEVYLINSTLYTVIPGAGNRGRRLVVYEAEGEAGKHE